jgi:hypothetical protein
MAEQETINEKGDIEPKFRVTHDQSYNVIPNTRRSVNDRVIEEELTPCRYGRAFSRHIHWIAHLRLHFPQEKIFQVKSDYKSAYRRMHNAAHTAVQAAITIGGFLLLALRLTFGGKPNPSRWSDLSEMLCDLGNDILRSPESWDLDTLRSPHLSRLPAQPIPYPVPSTAVHPAAPIAIQLPAHDFQPKVECFIDDKFVAFLEKDMARGRAILPFLLHLIGRPVHDHEPIPRDDLLSLKKFLAEATPAERQIILGWVVDTRRFIIELPQHKVKGWIKELRHLRKTGHASEKELDSLIGRLNHVGYVLPAARHFLGRLRQAKFSASKQKGNRTDLIASVQDDMELWEDFIESAGQGVSINLLTLRDPTKLYRVDASTHGMGGYNLTSGNAWRFEIPTELRHRATLNTLEFMAGYISLAVEHYRGNLLPNDIFLVQGDSTSAAGWMRKSNFDDTSPLQLKVARTIARLLMKTKSALHSLWFAGIENIVADCLSRDHHLTDDQLLTLLYLHVPEQLPPGFHISQLPRALSCQVTSWLVSLPQDTQLLTTPTRSKLATGDGILNTSTPSNLATTPSLNPLTSGPAPASSAALSPPTVSSDSVPLITKIMTSQWREHAAVPLTQWLRPSGLTTSQAPYMMNKDTPFTFYGDNLEVTPT